MTVRIKNDTRGDLREGYFFSITSDYGDAFWDPRYDPPRSKDATYYDAEEGWMYCSGQTGTICEAIKPCSRNPKHYVPQKIVAAKWIEAHGGDPFPFIPSFEFLFINEDLANRLKASPLIGADPIRVGKLLFHYLEEEEECPPVFALRGAPYDRWLTKPDIIDPPDKNHCPFCGHSPVLCPECGDYDTSCPSCKEEIVAWPDKHQGRKDPRILRERFTESTPLDVSRWDGSDFINQCGDWITKRALDFLISIHARPFSAVPLKADVSGLTDEQWKRLELSTKPVS